MILYKREHTVDMDVCVCVCVCVCFIICDWGCPSLPSAKYQTW